MPLEFLILFPWCSLVHILLFRHVRIHNFVFNHLFRQYLRHWDDHEIQPVPRISEEGEVIYGEASGHNFSEGFKRIDTREGVPAGQRSSFYTAKTGGRGSCRKGAKGTYSTCLDHSGGSLNVMNIQLVKIVHMMIMLNNVRRPELRKVLEFCLNNSHAIQRR